VPALIGARAATMGKSAQLGSATSSVSTRLAAGSSALLASPSRMQAFP
jgi:hypothetical protein